MINKLNKASHGERQQIYKALFPSMPVEMMSSYSVIKVIEQKLTMVRYSLDQVNKAMKIIEGIK